MRPLSSLTHGQEADGRRAQGALPRCGEQRLWSPSSTTTSAASAASQRKRPTRRAPPRASSGRPRNLRRFFSPPLALSTAISHRETQRSLNVGRTTHKWDAEDNGLGAQGVGGGPQHKYSGAVTRAAAACVGLRCAVGLGYLVTQCHRAEQRHPRPLLGSFGLRLHENHAVQDSDDDSHMGTGKQRPAAAQCALSGLLN